jgi:hypothetical protein
MSIWERHLQVNYYYSNVVIQTVKKTKTNLLSRFWQFKKYFGGVVKKYSKQLSAYASFT